MGLIRQPPRFVLTAGLAVLAVAFSLTTTTVVFGNIQGHEDRTRAAAIVSVSLQGALVALIDEETGIRGYVATGVPEFLEPYHSGLAAYRVYRTTPKPRITSAVAAAAIERFHRSADALQPWYPLQLNRVAHGASAEARKKLPVQEDLFQQVREDQSRAAREIASLLTTNRRLIDRSHHTAYLLMSAMGVVLVFGGVAASLFAAKARDNATLARSDFLTKLPNRRAFDEKLEELLGSREVDERLAVLYADLDGFKAINDRLGHDGGDLLLAACGERFRRALRPGDFVARIGGDEFAAILHAVESRAEAEAIAARIVHEIEAAFVIGGSTVRVSASVGIGLIPDDANTGGDLVRIADEAMYHLKRERRAAAAE